ncbi:hypothetical protein FSC37_09185 [Piscinibacter aquaticus]|uniref:Uncharacterized protein n=1 Tax=Piscinibacter aquaticus TaxID=392597 RepID=A0A5C6TZ60_9BURK|nr:hypothetical protein FSC37_09185 [Piscinibacter aquaticus]
MLQTYPFPAGGRQIDAKADFFRYESSVSGGADDTIRVRADGNDLGLFSPGDSIKLPITASRWEITPITGTVTGAVRIGVGPVQSARVAGNVRVIDEVQASCQTASAGIPGAIGSGVAALRAAAAGLTLTLRQTSLNIAAGAGGQFAARVVASPAAPLNFSGVASQLILSDLYATNGQSASFQMGDLKKRLPTGWGVYILYEVVSAASTGGGASLSFEVA